MQDFSQEFAPYTPPAQTDARGVFVATNANTGQTVVGMPGSRLGVVSPWIGPNAGPPGFQTQGFGPGVMIGSMGEPAADVAPYGHRPPTSAPGGGELSPYGITANTGTPLESGSHHGQHCRTGRSERPTPDQPGPIGTTPPAAAAEPLQHCAPIDRDCHDHEWVAHHIDPIDHLGSGHRNGKAHRYHRGHGRDGLLLRLPAHLGSNENANGLLRQ
jgi:hypothetical protein